MSKTFYLRDYAASFPCPMVKQSADTITATGPGLASYTSPYGMAPTEGTRVRTTQFYSDEPGTPFYLYFGTFVSDALPAQTIGGTVTVGLALKQGEDPISTVYARIKIYKWMADNKFGSDLLALANSSVSVPYWTDPTAPTVFFTTQALTSTSFAAGDKLVIEIEAYCNHTNTGLRRYWLDFNGPSTGMYASYITFSDDVITGTVPSVDTPQVERPPLILYDYTMKRIAIIDDYEYLEWIRNVYVPDTWEMRINRNLPNASLLLSSRYTDPVTGKWKYGGFVELNTNLGKKVGFMDRVELVVGEDGKESEMFSISGLGIEGILGTRIALYGTYAGDGYDTQTGYGETLFRHYIAQQCIGSGGTPPIAAFWSTAQSGEAPLGVTVVNQSSGSGPLTYAWDFTNDGVTDSTLENPPGFTYSTSGTYICRLTVTNPYGTSTTTKTYSVSTSGIAPVANFSASLVSGIVPLTIAFTDTSTNTPTSWLWDFGDGVTSALQNPSHTYSSAGLYTVSLTATNAGGSNTKSVTGYITVTDPSGLPTYGAPSSLNGYAIGGALQVTSAGYTFGGGVREHAIMTGDYIVNDLNELRAACSATQTNPNKTIYIMPNADINVGNEAFNVYANTTIASNRGYGGSEGGRVRTSTPGTSWHTPIFRVMGNNVHFTGLRLQGECYAEDYLGSETGFRAGILNQYGYTGLEVDNCELQGFAYACVYVWNVPTAGRPWIHHNWIHDSRNRGEGYGVNVKGGDCLIEGNVSDRCRHFVTGEGNSGEKYTARYNKVLGNGVIHYGTHFDVHLDESHATSYAGYSYEIYNNTIDNSPTCAAGNCMPFLQLMWTPQSMVYVHHNIVNSDWGSGASDWGYSYPIRQKNGSPTTITITSNYWKGTLYLTNTGMVFYT